MHDMRNVLPVILFTAIANSSCLTFSVTDLANRPHYTLAPIAKVAGAARNSHSLFVTFDVAATDRSAASSYTLEFPIDMPNLVGTNQEAPDLDVDGLELHHIAAANLRSDAQAPPDSHEIPILPVTVWNMQQVPILAREIGPGLHVFSVTYTPAVAPTSHPRPSSGRALPAGSILAVVQVSPQGQSEPVLIADVHQKTHTHGAWILLTPLAVAGDVVTFPLQVIAILGMGC
jgi:hypothetical protein